MMQEQMPIVTSELCRELLHISLHRQRAGSQLGITSMSVGLVLDPGLGAGTACSIKCILQVNTTTVPAGWR